MHVSFVGRWYLCQSGIFLICRLQCRALSSGSDAAALAILISPAVQAEIEAVLTSTSLTSLDTERKVNMTRMTGSEAESSSSRALSRNEILRTYNEAKSATGQKLESTKLNCKRTLHITKRGWPQLRPPLEQQVLQAQEKN